MDPKTGPPPGLPRPKSATENKTPPLNPLSPFSPLRNITSPTPLRAMNTSWASSLAAGLFPATFPVFPQPAQLPRETQPLIEAVHPVGHLYNSGQITDLGSGLAAPSPLDPWHRAHVRVCAHATAPCAVCSVSLTCCSCRALCFTPGAPPASPPTHVAISGLQDRRSRSASPALFRTDIGNGTPPPGFDSCANDYDDDAYAAACADADTCDNSSCPNSPDAPAHYTITVEAFDDGAEEFYDRTYHACTTCNRSCKKSFLGNKIKSRLFDNSACGLFDNSAKDKATELGPLPKTSPLTPSESALPSTAAVVPGARNSPLDVVTELQDALRTLNARPPTPAAFVATVCVKHDAMCVHSVTSCSVCSLGLLLL